MFTRWWISIDSRRIWQFYDLATTITWKYKKSHQSALAVSIRLQCIVLSSFVVLSRVFVNFAAMCCKVVLSMYSFFKVNCLNRFKELCRDVKCCSFFLLNLLDFTCVEFCLVLYFDKVFSLVNYVDKLCYKVAQVV